MAARGTAGRAVRARAIGWSLTSWVLFAGSGPLAKGVMAAGWSPAQVTSARIAVAAMLLVTVVAVLRPRALRFGRGEVGLLLGYGLLGVAGVQVLFFVAVDRIPVGVAMVLVNLAPALVALWVRTVRRTRLPGTVWLGIGAAAGGSTLVAQIWQGTRVDLFGIAAGLGSALCSAGFFLLGEHGARKHDPAGLTAIALALGMIAAMALAPPWTLSRSLLTAPVALHGARIPAWSVLLVLAVLGTVVPYLAGLHAMRYLSSASASVLAVVEPLVAAALAWLLFGQSLGPGQLAGAVIMLTGALLVQVTMPSGREGLSTRGDDPLADPPSVIGSDDGVRVGDAAGGAVGIDGQTLR
uniref:EamA family transporter n=1 Tax=Nocardia terrae TaxID=2675851 RepID=UPI0018E03335|nr:EamA family transporter [Nocardia terrae]